mgnify:CR=1 FL=1
MKAEIEEDSIFDIKKRIRQPKTMPEGPEVRRIAEGLGSVLVGSIIYGPTITPQSRYHKNGLVNSHLFGEGAHVNAIVPKGKKIIFHLSLIPPYSGQIWMISSLGMEGKWRFQRGNNSGIQFTVLTCKMYPHYRHLHYQTLYYDDSRHFGSLEIGTGPIVLKDVGPSFMQDEVTLEHFATVVRNPRISSKPIGDFLLEQKYVSGIGNYLRADILYLAQINPFRSCGSLSDNDIVQIYIASLDCFRTAYESNGHTIRTYFTPIGETGAYDPLVYNKSVSPAGNPVRKDELSKRTIHWDPIVQQ